jgi:hypothetical protein
VDDVNPDTLNEFVCEVCENTISQGNESLISKSNSNVIKAIELRCNHCKQKWYITEKIPLPDILL